MQFNDLIKQTSEWLKATGPESDIVISTRIRLARNIDGYMFVEWSDNETKSDIVNITKDAILAGNYTKNAVYVEMDKASAIDRQFLLERHLISREHAVDTEYKTVFIGDREIISIMVNEEDHLRLQVIESGFVLDDAWGIMSTLEADLEKRLKFAFSDEWGYLTACPTNAGTGLRASVMMHLPAIVMTRQIDSIIDGVSKLGLTVRGFFGEGTEALGNFFQVSNQVTLGKREEDIIEGLKKVIMQIIIQEKTSRDFLRTKKKDVIEDRISRAYATFEAAHIITSKETIDLLSLIRLGLSLKVLKNVDVHKLNELLILTQPAHLQKLKGKQLTAAERDTERAELIREKLGIK